MRKVVPCLTALLLATGSAAWADVKFTRLDEDQFIVHHRKLSALGAEAKATRTAFKEAASICIAAGFTHMEVKDLNVGERSFGGTFGGGRGASADLQIKLYNSPDEQIVEEKDLLACEPLSDPEKVAVARRKLAEEREKP